MLPLSRISKIVDSLLKETRITEAGVIDYVRNLAAKFGLKVPTKQEAIVKLKDYLSNSPETVNEALKYYHAKMKTAAIVETHPKVLLFVIMLMLILFGYNLARTTHEIKSQLRKVETMQDIEIQKLK